MMQIDKVALYKSTIKLQFICPQTPYAKYAPVDYTSPKIKQAASDETDPQHINPTLKSNFNKVTNSVCGGRGAT